MRAVAIESASRRSTIWIGERLQNLPQHLPPGPAVIITDANLLRLYREDFPPLPVLSIGCGESVKTLETVKSLYETLADLEADRSTFLLGIGGGVVCDVAGKSNDRTINRLLPISPKAFINVDLPLILNIFVTMMFSGRINKYAAITMKQDIYAWSIFKYGRKTGKTIM